MSRILLLTDSFLPHAGGSRVYYYNLYRRLASDLNHQVTILTKKVPGWKEFDASADARMLTIRRRFRPLPNWKYKQLPKLVFPLLEAAFLVARLRPDAIHAGDVFPQAVVALILGNLFGIRYLIYGHGEEITQLDRNRYLSRVRDWVYRNAAAVVCNSEFTRAQLLRIGVDAARIHLLSPAVDCDRFSPALPSADLQRKYKLEGCKVVLTVGRLVPRKGHRLVLEAIARLQRSHPDVRYLIAGTGPEEENLRAQAAALNIQHQVCFAGYVPDETLADHYNLADIVVMPNREEAGGDVEGFGMVFLESNACGKPVIGGRSGGAGDAIADGVSGFLVDTSDSVELAARIALLLGDASLGRRLGAQGRERARTQFNWDSRAALLHAVQSGLVARAAGAVQPSLPHA